MTTQTAGRAVDAVRLMRAQVQLLQLPLDTAEAHVLRQAVDLAVELTDSITGHAHYVQEAEITDCDCAVEQVSVNWLRAVRGRVPQQSHLAGQYTLDVPVVVDGRVEVALGLSGRTVPYGPQQLEALESLSRTAWLVIVRLRQYRTLQERLGLLIDRQVGAGLTTWEWDPSRRRLRWDDAAAAVVPGLEVTDTTWRSLSSLLDEQSATGLAEALEVPEFSLELTGDRGEGQPLRLLCQGSRVKRPDGAGALVRGTMLDISVVAQLEQAHHRATHDALTGLPNRAWLIETLGKRVQRRSRRRFDDFALLFIDLDDFKSINDTYGHLVGDQVLVAIANRIAAAVRGGERPARYGGDEFVVIEDGPLTWESIEALAQRIRAAVAEPISVDGRFLRLGASVGVALHMAHSPVMPAPPVQQLLQCADAALYEAKESAWGVVVREL